MQTPEKDSLKFGIRVIINHPGNQRKSPGAVVLRSTNSVIFFMETEEILVIDTLAGIVIEV